MIDASIALLKCVIDYGLCIWAFSWFAKRKSENRALFLGSIFLSSLLHRLTRAHSPLSCAMDK